MTDPAFYHKDGSLFWTDWCWGDDDWARARMEKMARLFEADKWKECQELAAECRTALAEYDAWWADNENDQLQYETETGAYS